MSYEGYEVWVCENGHEHTFDCYDTPDKDDWKCDVCGKPVANVGYVDETNCLPYYLNFKLKMIYPGDSEKCPTCGHSHITSPPRYEFLTVPVYVSKDGNYYERN